MKNPFNDVKQFLTKTQQPMQLKPQWPQDIPMRMALIIEEHKELIDARFNKDFPEWADAIIDLLYVTIGAGIAAGINLEPLWDEVHHANMQKFPGTKRQDGKQLKPEGWSPPNITAELTKQGWKP